MSLTTAALAGDAALTAGQSNRRKQREKAGEPPGSPSDELSRCKMFDLLYHYERATGGDRP